MSGKLQYIGAQVHVAEVLSGVWKVKPRNDLHGNRYILAPSTHSRVHVVRMMHGARHHQPGGACRAVRGGPRGKRSLHAVCRHAASKLWKLQNKLSHLAKSRVKLAAVQQAARSSGHTVLLLESQHGESCLLAAARQSSAVRKTGQHFA